ncbi:MAG TPA: four-helix bundle copper-binding protein [Phycisphaerales bacterium]|nr:four-helix bundle copper-binding protein [Phycisphaerales bacterium]
MQHDQAGSMEACAKICHECEDECLRTIVHCLELGGEHASKHHQTILADCAAICAVSHNVLHRQSPLHIHTCRACAAICAACADECEKMSGRARGGAADPMARCAATCRRCAESCEAMAGAPH